MKKPVAIILSLLVAAAIIVALVTVFAAPDDESSVQQIPSNATQLVVDTETGKQFAIHLTSNPTTGYSWKASYEPQLLRLINATFVPGTEAAEEPQLGAGGEEVFTFEALSPGETRITFSYLREWENNPPLDSRVFIVDIGGEAANATSTVL